MAQVYSWLAMVTARGSSPTRRLTETTDRYQVKLDQPRHRTRSAFTVERVLLSMLPALVNEFDAVAVRVKHICSIVTRVIVESGAGCAIVGGSCRNRGGIGRFHQTPAIGDKADMRGMAIRPTFAQPQVQASVRTESCEIRMAWRTVPAVVIKALIDAERSQRLFVKQCR